MIISISKPIVSSCMSQNLQVYPEERSNQHNVIAENEGLDLSYNFSSHPIPDVSQIVRNF